MTTQSDSINELSQALIAAQSLIQPAKKDSVNPHFKSGYASLQSVWDSARAVLAPHGLAISQGFTESNGESVTVTTTLVHKSGQWIRSALTMKPQRADPQGIGSAITYGRRYGLSAMLGIVADEDDDGNAASHPPAHQEPRKSPAIAHREPIGTPVQHIGAAMPKIEEPHALPPVEQPDWKSFPCPKFIKKNKTIAVATLGELNQSDLNYWANTYEPKPWIDREGKERAPGAKDYALKEALLAAVGQPKAATLTTANGQEEAPF